MPPFYGLLRQFFNSVLKRLQRLGDLDPERFGNRGFDPFLDRLQICACLSKLISECLDIAGAELTQHHL